MNNKLRYGLVLFLLLFSSASAQQNIRQLHTSHGEIIFAALFSVPETQNQFIELLGEQQWETNFPNHLTTLLTEEQKSRVIKTFSDSFSSNDYDHHTLKRLGYWVLAQEQIDNCIKLTSLEETMSAIYAVVPTPFTKILTNRNIPQKSHPLVVGLTLSAAESSSILYETLNTISAMPIKNQLHFFEELYAKLAKIKIQK